MSNYFHRNDNTLSSSALFDPAPWKHFFGDLIMVESDWFMTRKTPVSVGDSSDGHFWMPDSIPDDYNVLTVQPSGVCHLFQTVKQVHWVAAGIRCGFIEREPVALMRALSSTGIGFILRISTIGWMSQHNIRQEVLSES